MGRAKDIVIKVIPTKVATEFVRKYHYSGTVSQTSQLHFGCFLDDALHGVMSFGSPMDKGKVIGLVSPCKWNEMLELNRMAFDDYLPRNSESRCISVAIKLIRKNAPHIKWILSYSDAVQCGDGTIYRASGFLLTGVKKSTQIIELPWGERVTRMTLTQASSKKRVEVLRRLGLKDNGSTSIKMLLDAGARNVDGFQNRYIYLIDKACRLTVPALPYDAIDKAGAGMYKGKSISIKERNKQRAVSVTVAHSDSIREEGFDSTTALETS